MEKIKKIEIGGMVVLLTAVLIRMYLFTFLPRHTANPWDSVSYGEYAVKILTSGNIEDFLNPVRPPVYPTLLAISMWIGQDPEPEIIHNLNGRGGVVIAWFQTIISIFSAFVLYKILRLFLDQPLAAMVAILYAINPLLIPWDRQVLTESLSLSFIIFYIFFTVWFIQKPTIFRGMILLIVCLISTWLRSVFVLFFPLSIAIICLYKRDIKIWSLSFFLIMVFILPLYIHIRVNDVYHNNSSFQIMSSINMFGRVLVYPYPITDIPNNRISQWMKSSYRPGISHNPFPILESMNPNHYADRVLNQEMKLYTSKTLVSNAPMVIVNLLKDIPKIYEVNATINHPEFPSLIRIVQQLYVVLFALGSCALILLPLAIRRLIQTQHFPDLVIVFAGLAALYLLVASVVYGYVETSRYAIGTIPFLYVYMAGMSKLAMIWWIEK